MDLSGRIVAVLTGDIVGSSKLEAADRRKLLDEMQAAAEELCGLYPKAIPLPADIVRGDSWQILVIDLKFALHAAVFYRASIKARMRPRRVNTRLVLALGTVDFVAERVSESDGQAFRLSGKALESMHKNTNMRLISPGWQHEPTVDAMLRLLDALMNKWTPKQALAVTGALRGWTQKRIAKLWKKSVSQATVARHLAESNWDAVRHTLQVWNILVSDIQTENLTEQTFT